MLERDRPAQAPGGRLRRRYAAFAAIRLLAPARHDPQKRRAGLGSESLRQQKWTDRTAQLRFREVCVGRAVPSTTIQRPGVEDTVDGAASRPDLEQQAAIIVGLGRIDLETLGPARVGPRIYERTAVALRLLERRKPRRHAATVREHQPFARLRTIRRNGVCPCGISPIAVFRHDVGWPPLCLIQTAVEPALANTFERAA